MQCATWTFCPYTYMPCRRIDIRRIGRTADLTARGFPDTNPVATHAESRRDKREITPLLRMHRRPRKQGQRQEGMKEPHICNPTTPSPSCLLFQASQCLRVRQVCDTLRASPPARPRVAVPEARQSGLTPGSGCARRFSPLALHPHASPARQGGRSTCKYDFHEKCF